MTQISDPQSQFNRALQLAQSGELEQARNKFNDIRINTQTINLTKRNRYGCFLNMSTLQYQRGFLKDAIRTVDRAINIDPCHYIAHYNKFMYQYSVAVYYKTQQYPRAYDSLLIALSCLHTYIAAKLLESSESDNDKFNKVNLHLRLAIQYCENNAMSYLIRAKMYESADKLKLAENDYDLAQDYCKDCLFELPYLMRAQFNWRLMINTHESSYVNKIQTDLKQYHRIIATQVQNESQGYIFLPKQLKQSELSLISNLITEKCQEFEKLMQELKFITQIKKNYEVQELKSEQNLLQDDNQYMNSIGARASEKIEQIFNKNQNQQIEDSLKNISLQIHKLQSQIKNQGGKLKRMEESGQANKSNSQEEPTETFLTAEIQKAVQDIEILKKQSILSPSSRHSKVTEGNSDDDYSSKSVKRIIQLQELFQFSYYSIEIVSAQIFEGSYANRTAYVNIKYGQIKKKTAQNKQMSWHQAFDMQIQKNDLKTPEDQFISVSLQLTSRSIWGTKVGIGQGQINLLEMGQNNCLLLKNEKKTAIVYYKLKLR